MTEERKKILAAVTERAENFVKGFDPEFAAGYMKKREEAEAEELLIRAGELMVRPLCLQINGIWSHAESPIP